jgi:hypothetical protein
MPVPRFQFYFLASNRMRFCSCELLLLWKWRRFLSFYPVKTLASRGSEVKGQVERGQIQNELIEMGPTKSCNLRFEVASSEVRL